MSDIKSFFWAIAQSIWSALLAIIVVPFYIKTMGLEGYGLVGFFVSLQALIIVFDFGLTPAISRETARLTELNKKQELKKTILTLEVFILVTAFLIGLLMGLASNTIAVDWLQTKEISRSDLRQAILLMCIGVAAKLPIGFYHGILIGSGRLKLSSQIQIVFGTASSLGAVFLLIFVAPSILTFFTWQAFVSITHLICVRFQISYTSNERLSDLFSVSELQRLLPFSIPMAGVATTSLIFTQMDRVLLSKILSLDEFAVYAAAVLFASGLHIVVMPLFNSIYPKLIVHIERKRSSEALHIYITVSSILAGVLLPAAGFFAINANFFLLLWTNNQDLSGQAAPVLVLLLLGYALNGIMYPAYALQLAYGKAQIPLVMNIALGAFLALVLYFLATRIGIVGAGLSWLGASLVYLLIGTWVTWFFLKLETSAYVLLQRIVLPSIALVGVTLTATFGVSLTIANVDKLWVTALVSLALSAFQLFLYKDTRTILFSLVRWMRK